MNSKKIGGILLAVSVIIIFGFGTYLLTKENTTNSTAQTQPSIAVSTNSDDTKAQTETPTALTAEEVAKHSSKDNCWTIIEGKVYDITKYVPRHPGGDEILQACGKDGTSLFTERKTSDGTAVGSGTSHSGSATSQLQQFFVGPLQ